MSNSPEDYSGYPQGELSENVRQLFTRQPKIDAVPEAHPAYLRLVDPFELSPHETSSTGGVREHKLAAASVVAAAGSALFALLRRNWPEE